MDITYYAIQIKAAGYWVRGWSPTHQQPICRVRAKGASRFVSIESATQWLERQPGFTNYGGHGAFAIVPYQPT